MSIFIKHLKKLKRLNIKKDSKVLDMACGWAPFTRYIVEERGASSIGLTLSKGQAQACQKNRFNVRRHPSIHAGQLKFVLKVRDSAQSTH